MNPSAPQTLLGVLLLALYAFVVGLIVAIVVYICLSIASKVTTISDVNKRQYATIAGALIGLIYFLANVT